MADLPDFLIQIREETLEATSLKHGADAAKPSSPEVGDVYLATDTKKLYVCAADGSWTGFDYGMMVQGAITLFANLVGGSKRITSIADPTAAQDAATRAYVDAVDDKLDDCSQSQPTRALGTIYQNTSGKIRICTVSVSTSGTDILYAYVENDATPAIEVVKQRVNSDIEYAAVTFVVPSGWYYEVDDGLNRCSIVDWTEWDLH